MSGPQRSLNLEVMSLMHTAQCMTFIVHHMDLELKTKGQHDHTELFLRDVLNNFIRLYLRKKAMHLHLI